MSKRLLLIIVFMSVTFVTSLKSASNNQYALITLKGSVNPIIAEYIVNSIAKANQEKLQFVVLTVDTPGGLMTSMREIISAILNSDIPVIVYTYPKGAQAASAGGFIMLSADINAMSPGTEIGAMHPVSPLMEFSQDKKGNKNQKNVMGMKVLNDTVAYARSLAQKRNRNVKWAEKAVRKAISSSYLEAKRAGIVDIIANDIDDLLKQLNGRKVKINEKLIVLNTENIIKKEYLMHWKERFLNFFADPQIVFFLFIIAIIGIGLEVKSPGLIVPGTIGAIALFLFLMAVRILPINFAGLALIILAIVLFILELSITSYGLLTIGGLISFVLGSMILFDSPLPGFSVPIQSIIASVLFILALLYFVVRSVINAHTAKVATGMQGIIGEQGKVLSTENNECKIIVHGEVWSASSTDNLAKGDFVEVVKISGMNLLVRKISNIV